GASDVVDVELRARLFGQLVRHQAGEHVGRTGRREWDDDAYRPHRIALRVARARSKHGGSGGEMQKPATGKFHLGPSGSDGAGAQGALHTNPTPFADVVPDESALGPNGDVSGLTTRGARPATSPQHGGGGLWRVDVIRRQGRKKTRASRRCVTLARIFELPHRFGDSTERLARNG